MMTKHLLALVAFISLCTGMSAGSFRHLSIAEGLSSRQVYQVCKDSAGFVWAYTHLGVDRYDGNRIRHYELDETIESRDHILSFTIMKIDSKGDLWVTYRSGRIYKYDRLKDAFFLQADLSQFISPPVLNDIEFDGDKGLWLCTSTGVHHWDSETNSLSPAGVMGEWINCIIKGENETFYVGTNTEVYKLRKTGTTCRLAKEQVRLPVETRIESLYIYGQKLYVGTFMNGAFIVELQTGAVKSLHEFIPSVPVRAFVHDKEHAILIGVDGSGIFKIDDADDSLLTHYTTDEDDDKSLNGNTVSDICVDEYGGIWVSTNTNGISYMAFDNADVRWVKHERNNSSSLQSDHVNVILQDTEGDYWYGTNDGISLYRTKLQQWTHFLSVKETSYSSVVLTLCEDNEGYVWAGGYGIGLYRINKRNGDVKKMPNRDKLSDNGISTDYIYSIYADGDYLYFGGIEGDFVRYNRRNDAYTYYPIDCVGDIKYGDKNTLLLAACDGLGYFDKTTGEVSWLQEFGDVTLRYPIRCLFRSSSGDIWLLTDGEGLIRFNPQSKKSRIYTVADGLASNSINSIVEDSNGHIWFNTEKELYCLDLLQDVVMNGNDLMDIGWGYYNANAALRTKEGRLAFGTAQGALFFAPAFDFPQSVPVELIFTDFKLPYEPVMAGMEGSPLKVSINETQRVKLKHDQNSFSITFSAINFVSPHKVRYEYRLKNHEQQWHRVDAVQSVDYMDLSPGSYTFELRAFDKYTGQQVGERTIDIYITRPLWTSWWVITIYLLLLLALAYLFFQFIKQRMHENRINEKIQSFIGIAHDLRTPVALIKLPLSELETQEDMSEENRKKLDIAVKNADKLFTMITQLLDLQRTEALSEHLEVMSYGIHSYLEDKLSSFHMAAAKKEIDIYLDVEPDMPEVWLNKDKMDHIMDNLLSNALKYTEKGTIGVIVRQSETKWSITVKDTGVGIPVDEQKNIFTEYFRAGNVKNMQEQGIGMGLMITSRFIRQHHGKIEFKSKENEGSTFTVTFPKKLKSGMVVVASEELQEEVPVSSSQINKRKIDMNTLLLAEDDQDMREYLVDSLSSEYNIVAVPDGKKALEMAKEINPDIIISDMMMPLIQGDELCRILKSSVETSHIPIILLTGLSERENIILGLEAGANDYMIKPFDLSVLKVRLRNIIQSRQHLRRMILSANIPTDDEVDYGSALDKEFLSEAIKVVNENISNPDFTVIDFFNAMKLSRTAHYNKIKNLTGIPPADFIRTIRLNRAKELLASHKYQIGEVTAMVGFSDPKYFGSCFKKEFGVTPRKI